MLLKTRVKRKSPRILDTIQGAVAAFATRRLKRSYTGPCVNIRRSSDNATTDIGFDSNGNLDLGAIYQFVGSNSAFVTTWYDQSGKGFNATQATTTKQPSIMASGVLIKQYNAAAIRFAGASCLVNTSLSLTSPFSLFTFSQLWNPRRASTVQVGSANDSLFAFYSNTGNSALSWLCGGTNAQPSKMLSGAMPYTFSAITRPTAIKTTSTFGVSGDYNTQSINAGTINGLQIGAYQSTPTLFLEGDISELILYNFDLSIGQRTAIENNHFSHYGGQNQSNFEGTYVFDGDSLTWGDQSSNKSFAYPAQLKRLTAKNIFLINDGVGGAQLTGMDTTASAAFGIDTLTYTRGPVTLVVWGGTNDIAIGGQDAATTYARLKTYLANRLASGKYNSIYLNTTIPRGTTVTTTIIFAYNALIVAGWNNGTGELATTYGVNGLTDLTQLSQFDADGDYTNSTYYAADFTHLTDVGYSIVAGAVKTTLGL